MIILDRKRIMITTTMLLLAICVYFVKAPGKQEVLETVTLPVSNKVIILDAGHRITR